MSSNALPNSMDRLFALAEQMADGCMTHQTSLGLVHVNESSLRGMLVNARQSDAAYQTRKADRLDATDALQTVDVNATAFLYTARDVLKPYLGNSWSQAWAQAGFLNNSLALPTLLDGRMELVKSLELYFAAHSSHENATLGITDTAAADLHDDLSDAVAALNSVRSDLVARKDTRDANLNTLREKMRDLIAELTLLLSDTDGRWLDFGLNIPGAPTLPETPNGLVVQGAGSGHLFAEWESAPRADRYRIYTQVVGVDADFELRETVTETSANLNTFTPGAVVRVQLTAVNGAGESLPSDPVEQTVT